MRVLESLDRWQRDGAITAEQYRAIGALVRKERWSISVELHALHYLGVLALAGGIAWTVTTYSERLGDTAILTVLTLGFAWSLYYCFAKAPPYSSSQVAAPTPAFDYVLYLGCLVASIEIGYVETRFHPFGANWDHTLLIGAALFFALAYRFDNRFVLTLALSSLGGWFGVRVTHLGLLLETSLRLSALTYGALTAAAGLTLSWRDMKTHFLDTYLHVAVNVLLFGLLSGVDVTAAGTVYFLLTITLSTVVIVQGVRCSRFAFVVYGVLYGYAALTSWLLRNNRSEYTALFYFVVSGSIVIIALVVLARRFGRTE